MLEPGLCRLIPRHYTKAAPCSVKTAGLQKKRGRLQISSSLTVDLKGCSGDYRRDDSSQAWNTEGNRERCTSSVLPEMVQSLEVSGFQTLAVNTLPKSGCTALGQKVLLTYTRLWALAL